MRITTGSTISDKSPSLTRYVFFANCRFALQRKTEHKSGSGVPWGYKSLKLPALLLTLLFLISIRRLAAQAAGC